MRNQYQVRDDAVAIKLKHKGTIIETLIDLSDLPKLLAFDVTWSTFWTEAGQTFYVCCNLHNHTLIYLHRFLLEARKGYDVDHRDHNGLNNRRSNIREVTKSENQLNRRLASNNKSGHVGVMWDHKREMWLATGKIRGKTKHLGRFLLKEHAINAATTYRAALRGSNGQLYDAGLPAPTSYKAGA